jgi:hypothetical protein
MFFFGWGGYIEMTWSDNKSSFALQIIYHVITGFVYVLCSAEQNTIYDGNIFGWNKGCTYATDECIFFSIKKQMIVFQLFLHGLALIFKTALFHHLFVTNIACGKLI